MIRRLVPLMAALACTEALPPERSDTYSFTIDCSIPDVCRPEADAELRLIFRWTADAMPVRVWVEPQGDLPQQVRAGIRLWESALLFGEFRAVVVSDSMRADVIVRRRDAEEAGGINGEGPPSCFGRTEVGVALDTTIVLPFRVRVIPRLGAVIQEVEDCLQTVVAHELGHTFGLLLHSPAETDLMHARPALTELSPADLATFAQLYHTQPTVRLPPGR